MKMIRILPEWFVNPNFLPFMAGIEKKWYDEAGFHVEIVKPDYHYEGFEELKKSNIEIATNEPLHIFELYENDFVSLGCYFETEGGVLFTKKGHEKLMASQEISITTPVSNPVTDRIGFEIVRRYGLKKGLTVESSKVIFHQTDFHHIKHILEDGYDAAWLCFSSYELIEAKHAGLTGVILADSELAGYPNFSALDVVTTKALYDQNKDLFQKFVETTNKVIAFLKENPEEGKKMYYAYTKESQDAVTDEIIMSTIQKFLPIQSSEKKWYDLYQFLKELGISTMDDDMYKAVFV